MNSLGQRTEVDSTGQIHGANNRGWDTSCALTWDAWNRPVTFNGGSANSYQYDALHRRIIKTIPGETRDYYFNNRWRAVEERVGGNVQAHYVWSPTDRWTLIRRKRTVTTPLDETLFVLKDYLDPAAVINTSAVVQERFSYDAFGPVRFLNAAFGSPSSSSTLAWNFLFHAEFRDTESGLYNYGFRYYHPYLGRWPSRDPVGEKGGVNLYAFVGNAAVGRVDVLGMAWYDWIPVVSTITHLAVTPKGVNKEDYSDPEPDCYCKADFEIESELERCRAELRSQFIQYLQDWLGVSIAADAAQTVAAIAAGAIARAGIRHGTRAAVGGTATAGVLVLDAVIDAAVVVKKANDIQNGYDEAVSEYCNCDD